VTEPIDVAVVGYGAFGRNHARVYAGMEEARLTAIVDRDQERLFEAEKNHPGVALLTDPSQLAPSLGAASIAVPTESHAAVACPLLARELPCLVEKPIAGSLGDADRILAAAGDTPLFVGHLERFNPAFSAIRPHVTHPRFIEVHRLGSFSPRSLDIDVVLDLMIHDLDLILLLAGRTAISIDAVGVEVLTQRIDIANARLHFPEGLVCNVTASRVSKERIRKFRIFQPHGYLSLDLAAKRFERHEVLPPEAPGKRPEVLSVDESPEGEEPLKAELSAFLAAAARSKGCRPAAGLEGRAALELALGVTAKMAGGHG